MSSNRILIANVKPFTGVEHKDTDLANKFNTLHFPINLALIASVLRNDFEIDTCDTYIDTSYNDLLQQIGNNSYMAVLLSGYLGNYSYKFLKTFASNIKSADGKTVIVLGGPMASAIPEHILNFSAVDFVVKGEGEEAILLLLKNLQNGISPLGINGVWGRKDGEIIRTAAKRLRDLDRFPIPAYDLFKTDAYVSYLHNTNRCFEILATRGCFGTCSYCCRVFKGFIARNSPANIVRHMEYVSEKFNISKFNFVDDNFLNSRDNVYEFIAELKKTSKRFSFRFQGRPDCIDLETLQHLTEVGLFGISFGIESGSPTMLKQYNKNFNINNIASFLAEVKELVEVHTTFILGGPGESHETINETKQFLKKARVKNAAFGILTLFPGTKLYEQAISDGLIQNVDRYLDDLGPVYEYPYVNISNLSDKELLDSKAMLTDFVNEMSCAD